MTQSSRFFYWQHFLSCLLIVLALVSTNAVSGDESSIETKDSGNATTWAVSFGRAIGLAFRDIGLEGKRIGLAIGSTAASFGKEIGHSAAAAGKEIGQGAAAAGKEIGQAAKEGGKAFGSAITGQGAKE